MGFEGKAEMNQLDARRVRDTCICMAVQSAGRAVGRRFDEAFRPLRINNWQFSLLMALSGSEPPTIGQVAGALSIDRTTITANLKPLERRGLVAVVQDDADQRLRRVRLTDAGRSLLADALSSWERVNAAILDDIGDVDRQALRAGLVRLATG